jgi:mono/diheme cytochrome c family protein
MDMIGTNCSGMPAQFLSLCLTLFLPSTASAGMGMMGGPGMGMMGNAPARHMYVMQHGLDEPYASMSNPLSASAENIKAGKALFAQNCVACHGATGRGDGVASKGLNPPPADLTRLARMRIASDGYLYWTIAEGGAQFSSAMPSMKASLSQSDIWKLVLYLRTF